MAHSSFGLPHSHIEPAVTTRSPTSQALCPSCHCSCHQRTHGLPYVYQRLFIVSSRCTWIYCSHTLHQRRYSISSWELLILDLIFFPVSSLASPLKHVAFLIWTSSRPLGVWNPPISKFSRPRSVFSSRFAHGSLYVHCLPPGSRTRTSARLTPFFSELGPLAPPLFNSPVSRWSYFDITDSLSFLCIICSYSSSAELSRYQHSTAHSLLYLPPYGYYDIYRYIYSLPIFSSYMQ